MAITIVTSLVASAGGGANITLPLDNAQTDDFVLTFGGFAGGSATAPGVISPSGFTSILVNDDANLDFKVEYKKMGATVDPSVLLAGSGVSTDSGGYGTFILRGVDTSSPFDATILSSIASGVPFPPSIVTNTSGAMVVAVGGNDVFDSSPGIVPGFIANIGASSNDTDDFGTAGAASVRTATGSFSPTSWTTWTAGNYVAATVALKPQAASNPDPMQSYIGVLYYKPAYPGRY